MRDNGPLSRFKPFGRAGCETAPSQESLLKPVGDAETVEAPGSPSPSEIAAPPSREESGGSCRCGAGPSQTRAGRCARGHVLRGNTLALVAGLESPRFWAEHEELRRSLVAGLVRDSGESEDNPPTALAIEADIIAKSVIVADSAYDRMLLEGGPLSQSGKARKAFTVWLAATDRLERHIRLVGLKRAPRPTLAPALGMLKQVLEHGLPDAASARAAEGGEGSITNRPTSGAGVPPVHAEQKSRLETRDDETRPEVTNE